MTDIIGPVKLDEKFLEECGLASLAPDEAKLLLEMFYKELEFRVGTALSNGLSDAQLSEFESFVDGDMPVIQAWLDTTFPRYEEEKTYRQIRESAARDTPNTAILQETASLLWLQVNRPEYKQTVARELETMRTELLCHRYLLLPS